MSWWLQRAVRRRCRDQREDSISDLDTLLEWTHEAASHLSGADQAVWLARIEQQRPEIDLALTCCMWEKEFETGLRIATNLGRYWWMCGHAAEGKRWLTDFVCRTNDNPCLRADALLALGGVGYASADYYFARRSLRDAEELFDRIANVPGKATALNQLGMVSRETGDLPEAKMLHEKALELFVSLDDEYGAVSCQSNLGVVALFAGDLDGAEGLHAAALAERRRLGDVRGVASSLGSLATIARWRGDLEKAQTGHEQALAMRQNLGDRWGIAGSLVNLAAVAMLRDNLLAASDLLAEATRGFNEVGDRLGLCETLDTRAELTAAEGHPAEAVCLFAASTLARGEIGAPLPSIHKDEVDRKLAELRALLSPEVFKKAWQAGLVPRYSPFPPAKAEEDSNRVDSTGTEHSHE